MGLRHATESHANGSGAELRAPAGVLYVASAARDRAAVRERLSRGGVPLVVVTDLGDAVSVLATDRFALCVIDLSDERTALAAIRLLRSQHPQQPLAGLIDPTAPLVAGQAVHAGLMDLLPWPFEDRDLLMLVSNARDRHGVEIEVSRPGSAAEALFAQAPAMRPVLELVRLASGNRAGVCICGEPGSGRELVARVIHAVSEPATPAFVMVDCADETPQDLERRLFGLAERKPTSHGSASPEQVGREGAILRARGGTLYLTGLVEAPSRVQAKLARLLRDREAIVADDRESVDLDLRPIGSFEPAVDAALADGRLRRDLFERLAQIRIDVPPLRRRRQDIPLLAAHFLGQLCEQEGLPARARSLSRSALALLAALPWHGNAGELRALLEVVLRSVRRPVIEIDDLLEHASLDGIAARVDTGLSLRDAKARFERECISAVLMRHHGRVGEAAKALGIQRTNLYRKVRQLNVARSLLSTRK